MAKILKISNDVVIIGTDNGQLKEVRIEDLNFTPAINDEVEVYENESSIIVSKKEVKIENPSTNGININLQNNQTIPNEMYMAQNKKVVNKVAYCLLAFFLGGIGVHKMYAGKVATGILYCLFCWTYIPAIIAFVDFISALCQKADSNGNILR